MSRLNPIPASDRRPTVFRSACEGPEGRNSPVGASLLAIAVGQLASVLTDPPPSRAGSLPQEMVGLEPSVSPLFTHLAAQRTWISSRTLIRISLI
ncbi:hypothetical protein FGE05_07280 [Pseudomonas sp. ICMP22404]|nr:hypothetical protein FGE05_07280 [Pseudomonas sp. ICMP22404]